MVMYFLARERLKNCQKIIIKIGSNALIKENMFNHNLVEELAKEIATLTNIGKEIILITSGAVALGKIITKTTHLSKNFYSSIGQKQLIHEYDHCFEKSNLQTSQLLITKDHLEEENSIKKLKTTINHAFELGVITIINENDAISNNSFENNDLLAADLSKKLNVDLLILLTNTNGIYSSIKKQNTISIATTNKLEKFIIQTNSTFGTGGMETKLVAAKTCGNAKTIIANASHSNILTKIIKGEDVGTLIQK
jgi:glutamate 5-kinase